MAHSKFYAWIEEHLEATITDISPVGGGSISSAYSAVLSDGRKIFFKESPQFPDMFIKEANGLNELRKAGSIRIPEVLFADTEILILENLAAATPAPRKLFFEKFGRQFASLHRFTGPSFGFRENNYIGSMPQLNINRTSSWRDFYFSERLLFQFQQAEKNGYADERLKKYFSVLERKIHSLVPDDHEPPCLLHGDLWSGNYLCIDHTIPALIDPAVYYGHREADIAMTLLFGGFDSVFYDAYQEVFPLAEGWKLRIELYKLYHLLNHLNLFGEGYYGQVFETMKELAK